VDGGAALLPLTDFSCIEDHQSGRELDWLGEPGLLHSAMDSGFAHCQELCDLADAHIS